jgi:hypothetical protein
MGYDAHFVVGDDPGTVHRALATTLDTCVERIRSIQDAARMRGVRGTPAWPAIVLRTPKGWTGLHRIGQHDAGRRGSFEDSVLPRAPCCGHRDVVPRSRVGATYVHAHRSRSGELSARTGTPQVAM